MREIERGKLITQNKPANYSTETRTVAYTVGKSKLFHEDYVMWFSHSYKRWCTYPCRENLGKPYLDHYTKPPTSTSKDVEYKTYKGTIHYHPVDRNPFNKRKMVLLFCLDKNGDVGPGWFYADDTSMQERLPSPNTLQKLYDKWVRENDCRDSDDVLASPLERELAELGLI